MIPLPRPPRFEGVGEVDSADRVLGVKHRDAEMHGPYSQRSPIFAGEGSSGPAPAATPDRRRAG
jgi:hypothetical protein